MELTLSNKYPTTTTTTILRGLIYCTDDISNTIVLKKSLLHTTLSSEITLVNAASVVERRIIYDYNNNFDAGDSGKNDMINSDGTSTTDAEAKTITTTTNTDSNTIFTEEQARAMAGVQHLDELKLPLPNVSAKLLEERERRALRLAEESLSHINQGVS